jgi:hypothetical protein
MGGLPVDRGINISDDGGTKRLPTQITQQLAAVARQIPEGTTRETLMLQGVQHCKGGGQIGPWP